MEKLPPGLFSRVAPGQSQVESESHRRKVFTRQTTMSYSEPKRAALLRAVDSWKLLVDQRYISLHSTVDESQSHCMWVFTHVTWSTLAGAMGLPKILNNYPIRVQKRWSKCPHKPTLITRQPEGWNQPLGCSVAPFVASILLYLSFHLWDDIGIHRHPFCVDVVPLNPTGNMGMARKRRRNGPTHPVSFRIHTIPF